MQGNSRPVKRMSAFKIGQYPEQRSSLFSYVESALLFKREKGANVFLRNVYIYLKHQYEYTAEKSC
jgi:hypothetical protein